jgi:hypothetical protein
MYEG